ncbi:MAG: sugar kinase [Anaerolineae bacterium]|nr:sugar kinase [Anaerolineae bacterium]
MAQEASPRVIALGETMLMFAPPGHELIEHSESFRAFIGGSEANVAVGLERLGVHAGWVGKLPRSALGRKVENGIRRYGVDTAGIVWSETGRVGTFYVEVGATPRPTQTIYDRAGSAFTTLTAGELDWDYIAQAEWLHLTGITPALSATCRAAAPEILKRARALGVKVSLDLNYRSKLWGPEAARAAWLEMIPHTNVLIATEVDAAILLGETPPEDGPPGRLYKEQIVGEDPCRDAPVGRLSAEMVRRLYAAHGVEAVAITCGGSGCVAFDGRDILARPAVIPEVVNRIGAGDAFAAGLLYGLITADLATGLAYGNAMAALKFTIPQNLPLVDRADVEAIVAGQAATRLVR